MCYLLITWEVAIVKDKMKKDVDRKNFNTTALLEDLSLTYLLQDIALFRKTSLVGFSWSLHMWRC